MLAPQKWITGSTLAAVVASLSLSFGFVPTAEAFPLFRTANGAPPPGRLPRNAARLNNLYDPIDVQFTFDDVMIELGFDGTASEGSSDPDPFDVTSIHIFGPVFGGGVVDGSAPGFDPDNSGEWFLDFTYDMGVGFNVDDPAAPFWFVNSATSVSDPGAGRGTLKLLSFGVDFTASETVDESTACEPDLCEIQITTVPDQGAGEFAFQFFPILLNSGSDGADGKDESPFDGELGDTGIATGDLCHGGNYGVDPLAQDDPNAFCAIHTGGFNIAAAVDEPGPLALIALGLGVSGLVMYRGRRRRR